MTVIPENSPRLAGIRFQKESGLGSVGNLSRLNWNLISTAGDINPREYDMLLIHPGSRWSLAEISLRAISPSAGLQAPEPVVKISDVQTILLTRSTPRMCATGVVLSTMIRNHSSANRIHLEV